MKPLPMLLGLVLLGLGAVQAATDGAVDGVAERRRIAAERSAVEASFAAQREECAQRFAVTPCLDAARAQRRDALVRLSRQESLLDEAQRKQRAAARIAAIRDKVSAEEARGREPVKAPRREPPMRVTAPRAGSTPAAVRPAAAAASVGAGEREAAEARSRARFEARQREAQAHRDEARQRAAQRARAAKPAASALPVPGS